MMSAHFRRVGTLASLIGLLGATAVACSDDGAAEPATAAEDDDSALYESSLSTSPPQIKSGYAPIGVNQTVQKVTYSLVDGMAVFEGDIILGTAAELEAPGLAEQDLAPLGVVISFGRFRWRNKLVPYTIDPRLPNQARVTDAIGHWRSKTDVRFIRRTSANASQYPDYVTFRPGAGCNSYVGRIGGQQYITLQEGCSTRNTIHEIGHAVGLWHEHSREDRDRFVTIHLENVEEGYEFAFDKHINDATDIGTYDYNSVMHYSRLAFSKNGRPTIVPKNGATIGPRIGLSAKDVSTVRRIYP